MSGIDWDYVKREADKKAERQERAKSETAKYCNHDWNRAIGYPVFYYCIRCRVWRAEDEK